MSNLSKICHSWLTMLKITILISKDYDIDIYKISRYIAKTVVLLSPSIKLLYKCMYTRQVYIKYNTSVYYDLA